MCRLLIWTRVDKEAYTIFSMDRAKQFCLQDKFAKLGGSHWHMHLVPGFLEPPPRAQQNKYQFAIEKAL
jgi:aspartyl/asparaginyl beta-hydroxylase (cupin superfamily)